MTSPEKLRELAAWYREYAERAGNPTIWDARLRTAEEFEAEAVRMEASANSTAGQHDALPPQHH